MIPLNITTNLDIDPWTDLGDEFIPGDLARIGILPNGTESGHATVCLLVTLPDGRQVVAQTTLRLFLMAAGFIAGAPVTQLEGL